MMRLGTNNLSRVWRRFRSSKVNIKCILLSGIPGRLVENPGLVRLYCKIDNPFLKEDDLQKAIQQHLKKRQWNIHKTNKLNLPQVVFWLSDFMGHQTNESYLYGDGKILGSKRRW